MSSLRTIFPLVLILAVVTAGCSITPVVVTSADGPENLLTEEEGTFSAAHNEDATAPVMAEWDFGDGSTASGLEAAHSYDRPGTYNVTVTVSNKKRKKESSDSRSMTVEVERPIVAPSLVTVTFLPSNPDTRTPVSFNANIRGDQPMTYAWDFGDGGSASSASPQHTFSQPGSYTVKLTATNEGGSDARSTTVTVVPYEAEICKELTDLNPAFFERNSSALTEEARTALADNASILAECPNMCVRVEGFSAPGERNPQDLSDARARAIQSFYTDNGIAASRIDAVGQGVVEGASRKEGLSQYRRGDSIPGACGM
jgi:PKD repeat protein